MSTVESKNYREQIESAFPFEVQKFRLSGPEGMITPHYGLFCDDGQCIGNAVSSDYCPHTRDDVAALVEASEHVFGSDVEFKAHFDAGHYVSVMPTLEHRRSIFGTEDNIFPRLMISAGYDGRAFQATMGYYRDACRNLAMLREVSGITRKIRHTSGLRDRMDDLIEEFRKMSSSWEVVAETAERMEAQQTDLAEFLEQTYGDPSDNSGRSKTIAVNRVRKIMQRVIRERQQTGRESLNFSNPVVSVWEAFNAVQGYEQHDATRRGNPSQWDRMLSGNRSQYTHKAEKQALELISA